METVGPEGLADVELWGTSDGGRTWAKWGSDPDKQSPFDVEVNGEALYGFRVVIVGKSGLASNAPQAGDAADIWVGIDLTRPAARLRRRPPMARATRRASSTSAGKPPTPISPAGR